MTRYVEIKDAEGYDKKIIAIHSKNEIQLLRMLEDI